MQYENQSRKIQGDKLETFDASSSQPAFSFKAPVSQDLEKKQGDPLFDAIPSGPAPVVETHLPKLAETLPEYHQGEITRLDQTPIARGDLKTEAQIGLEEAKDTATGMIESASSAVHSVFSSALGAIKDGAAFIAEKKDAIVENVKQAAVHAQYERVLGEVQYGFHHLKPVGEFNEVLREIETGVPQLNHAELYPNKEYRQVMNELESKPSQLRPVGQFEKILSEIESNPSQLKPVGEYQEVLRDIEGSQATLRPVGQFQEVLRDIESQPKPEFKQLMSEIEGSKPSLRPVGQFENVLTEIEGSKPALKPIGQFENVLSEIEGSQPSLRPVGDKLEVLRELKESQPALRPVGQFQEVLRDIKSQPELNLKPTAEFKEVLSELETADGQFDLKPLNRRPTAEFREVLSDIESKPLGLKPTGQYQTVLKEIEGSQPSLKPVGQFENVLSELQGSQPSLKPVAEKSEVLRELKESQPALRPVGQFQEVLRDVETKPLSLKSQLPAPAPLNREVQMDVLEVPAIYETVQKPAIVHETVRTNELIEIQPVIERERERLVVEEIVQPMRQVQVEAPQIRELVLPAKTMPVIREDDSKFVAEHSLPVDVSTTESSFESSTIYDAPIVHEHVIQKVIEEIQPIMYREVQRPILVKETQTIYERIVEAPVLKKRILPLQDLGVVKTEKYVERPIAAQVDLPAQSN